MLKEQGITPAYAGNTCKNGVRLFKRRDHPRLRGEYYKRASGGGAGKGSPPLARGIRVQHVNQSARLRITPAYTGNTLFDSICNLTHMDHPRLRGEYMIVENILPLTIGSPLLARGVRFW